MICKRTVYGHIFHLSGHGLVPSQSDKRGSPIPGTSLVACKDCDVGWFVYHGWIDCAQVKEGMWILRSSEKSSWSERSSRPVGWGNTAVTFHSSDVIQCMLPSPPLPSPPLPSPPLPSPPLPSPPLPSPPLPSPPLPSPPPPPPLPSPPPQISLQVAPSQVATEYYTAEEMVQFRKPRKKRKVRKRLKADDLLPLADEQTSKDHGSRYIHVLQYDNLKCCSSCLLVPSLSFLFPPTFPLLPTSPPSFLSLSSPPSIPFFPSPPHLSTFPLLPTSPPSLSSPPLRLPSPPHLSAFPLLPTSPPSLSSPPLHLPSPPHLSTFPLLPTSPPFLSSLLLLSPSCHSFLPLPLPPTHPLLGTMAAGDKEETWLMMRRWRQAQKANKRKVQVFVVQQLLCMFSVYKAFLDAQEPGNKTSSEWEPTCIYSSLIPRPLPFLFFGLLSDISYTEAEEWQKMLNGEGLGTLITWRGHMVDVGGGGGGGQCPTTSTCTLYVRGSYQYSWQVHVVQPLSHRSARELNRLIRESVDSLCRDGADAQYMQYLSKSRITSPQTR